MTRVEITVSVREADLGAVRSLAQRVESMGMSVSQVHETIGVITGSAEDAVLPDLRALQEVEAVETTRRIQLPPPESEVQ